VLTYLFDPMKGLDQLYSLEKQWGGTPQQRMARKYASYAEEYGLAIPEVPPDSESIARQVDAEARADAAKIEESSQGSQRTRPAAEDNAELPAPPLPAATPAASPYPTPTGAAR
jgi:penicillin-binding protein 2